MSFAGAVSAGIATGQAAFAPLLQVNDPLRKIQVQSLEQALKRSKQLDPFFEKFASDAKKAATNAETEEDRAALDELSDHITDIARGKRTIASLTGRSSRVGPSAAFASRDALQGLQGEPPLQALSPGAGADALAGPIASAQSSAVENLPQITPGSAFSEIVDRARARKQATLEAILSGRSLTPEEIAGLDKDTVLQIQRALGEAPSSVTGLGDIAGSILGFPFIAAEFLLGGTADFLGRPGAGGPQVGPTLSDIKEENNRRLLRRLELRSANPPERQMFAGDPETGLIRN